MVSEKRHLSDPNHSLTHKTVFFWTRIVALRGVPAVGGAAGRFLRLL